jgi:pseudouridine-5'-phosphate glycosidase
MFMTMAEHVDLAPEVRDAQANGAAVVALESTIIAHGLPRPHNLETAQALEAIIRAAGAVPATIAVLQGRIKIGLTPSELERLARAHDVMKLSRADLAFAVSARRDGATTVAATMICAALAGIAVFATGGIGGVHRGVETSLDVSADLQELARTPVAVVSAGAKAILDLPRTLEYLETLGVPVVGYRTREFPAFWSRRSELALDLRCDAAEDIARFIATRRALGIGGGILVANPVPERDEIAAEEIERHVAAAVKEADAKRIVGKALTPFLLERIVLTTGGRSLATNIALVKNNAALAGAIAVALARSG